MIKIIIPDHVFDDVYVEQSVLGESFDIEFFKPGYQLSQEQMITTDVLLLWHYFRVNENLLDRMPNCKLIVRFGSGLDSIDLHAAEHCNISVLNVSDYGIGEVADHTLSLLLALSRNILSYQKTDRTWNKQFSQPNMRLQGKTAGIIGLGRIGLAVAKRIEAFGMNILFYDPYVPTGYEKSLGYDRAESLVDIAKASSVVTLHRPLTNETRHLIDRDFFAHIESPCILINTSRGAVVNYNDLIEAYKKEQIQGIGLDVFEREPPYHLYENDRIIYTPHAAFYSEESVYELRHKAAKLCKDFWENV